MTSARQIAANRRNARCSTGPRTPRGKAAASRNAVRHGLGANVLADPHLAERMGALALAVAGEEKDANMSRLALIIARAQAVLERVRQARVAILEKPACGSTDERDDDSFTGMIERLCKLERYERRAMARQIRAIRAIAEYEIPPL
jgi:hypothetical protein